MNTRKFIGEVSRRDLDDLLARARTGSAAAGKSAANPPAGKLPTEP